MKCECCDALVDFENNYVYYCAVGEEQREFADGSLGCSRRSKEKLKKDLKRENELILKSFAEECKYCVEYFEIIGEM